MFLLYKTIRLYSDYFLFEEYLENDSIGEFIVKFKSNNNLTLEDISNMTGFSVSHISNSINRKLLSIILIKSIDKLKCL